MDNPFLIFLFTLFKGIILLLTRGRILVYSPDLLGTPQNSPACLLSAGITEMHGLRSLFVL